MAHCYTKRGAALVILIVSHLLSGCWSQVKTGDAYAVDPVFVTNRNPELNCSVDIVPFNLDVDRLPGESGISYSTVHDNMAARNRLQRHLMSMSDVTCECHKAATFGTSAGLNFVGGTASTIFGATGALVTGESASRILSGLAAAASATRAHINEQFYQNLYTTAIIKAVNNDRNNFRVAINEKSSKNIQEYSVDDAIYDVLMYHQKCSIYSGIVAISQSVERDSQLSQAVIKERIGMLFEQMAANEKIADKTQRDRANSILLNMINSQRALLPHAVNSGGASKP